MYQNMYNTIIIYIYIYISDIYIYISEYIDVRQYVRTCQKLI